MCAEYCDDYFRTCPTSNEFINANGANAVGGRNLRSLVTTGEGDVGRNKNLGLFSMGLEECRKTCMLWPRGPDPALYGIFGVAPDAPQEEKDAVNNSNLGGDTLWCRKHHLYLAEKAGDQANAAFHCPHSGNPSAGICRDSNVNGFTPYELLRDGQPTRYHFGYCDIAGDDTIAECTNSDITDANLAFALGLLPDTVEVIFLNGNLVCKFRLN